MDRRKAVYVHTTKAAITMARTLLENKVKENLPRSRISIRYNLANTEGIVKFNDVPLSWFMGKVFTPAIIKIYEYKDMRDLKTLVTGSAFTDKTATKMP